MSRSVFLLVAGALAAVFLASCGTEGIGDLRRESKSVDLDNAQSVRAELKMGAGELNLTGGADALMEGDFAYNVADWKPEVNYDVTGDAGELSVEQGSGEDIPVGGDARNEWDLRLNDDVPIDLNAEMGAGESDLDLDSLTLTGLDLQMGAGKTTVDLTGDYDRDLSATIEGGVGEATVELPSAVGVKVNAEGGLGPSMRRGSRGGARPT